jgi:hypothetical protein
MPRIAHKPFWLGATVAAGLLLLIAAAAPLKFVQTIIGSGSVIASSNLTTSTWTVISNVTNIFTNSVTITLQTTDITTNILYSFTPLDNSICRLWVNVLGYNSTASASYGKAATFKSVAGTVTQVGSTATIGNGEDDTQYECLVDTASNAIRVRVAGNTGRTVNWSGLIEVMYSQ